MSKQPSKEGRDQSLNFKGFLNGLQTFEDSMKDNSSSKPHLSNKPKSKVELVGEEFERVGGKQYHPRMDFDPLSNVSSSFMAGNNSMDAASEKDLGNEYFKQKKFNEAIDCYSRSIALSPTAVAYANRAMSYLKIKRFQEAEDDCTEALNLDDRYTKAYSRRATARKEIGKLRDSLEDAEFALRLEPHNEELKKQRAEVKSLLEKAVFAKAAGTTRRPTKGVKEIETKVDDHTREKREVSVPDGRKNTAVKKVVSETTQQVHGFHQALKSSPMQKSNKAAEEWMLPVQELASRAASQAKAEAVKNIIIPKSAYQFEVSWRGLSGDRSLQSHLLKVTPPDALPGIFKNALTAPLLVDIIKCLATLFTEETELVVKYLENLIKIPRFDMVIMCLSSADKADLCRIWNEVFLSKAAPIEITETLSEISSRYCPRL